MKRTGWMILAVIISLLLIANPVYARQGNGKYGGAGKSVNGGGSAGREAVKVVKENKGKFHQLKVRVQEREKASGKREFSDTKAHWAKDSIDKVQSLGWISGYPDMSFKPDTPVTGIEVVSMIVSLAEDLGTGAEGKEAPAVDDQTGVSEGEEEVSGDEEKASEPDEDVSENQEELSEGNGDQGEEIDIPDVPGWAKDAIRKAVALKIVNVNRFHSRVQATRAQAAVMLAKALGLQPVDTSGVTFSDKVLISSEDLGYILALAEAGIIKGTPDGKFNPNSAITRAEIAAMLAAVADRISDDNAGNTTDQTARPPADSAEQTLAQPTGQTTAAEGDTTGQAEQTAAETA
ncbi:MAG TPA: S-layer homology domain-containing protein [Syntrophomonadaceae bacterium]|nr:S-layer homology domain-containing protein [Syntrophomonadaceae bacterium]